MNEAKRIKVIVPEQTGADYLAEIDAIEAVVVKPDASIPESAQNAQVLVVGPAERQSEVDAVLRQISQLPQLKLLQTLGQGTEQWEGQLPDGLDISTARGAHGGSTAELAVAMLLSLIRELPRYATNQQQQSWDGRRAKTLLNANVLVYGASDLGKNIQQRLQPFGATVSLVGIHNRDGVIDTAAAQKLLPTADAVIMALPLTTDTKHTVNADFLAALPDGVIVINVGRGGLVDQDALLKELSSGRILAGLDVTTPEPLPADNPLWKAPNLLLTPHIGGNTDGADDRAWKVVAQQIKAFADKFNGSL